MAAEKLIDFLDGKGIKYVIINHSSAYTTSEIAASAHIKGQELAKTVIVKIDGELAMIVLPAKYKVNFQMLKDYTGKENIELAAEGDFAPVFQGCMVGAMPPFGNIYGLKTYLDKTLTYDEEIAFNAGNFHQLIKLNLHDYMRLVKPDITHFAAA
ncbi:aminoacyl-tRNA deacylase [Spirochaeta isovalerica]|uniref:Ala-tRNA(Pro) deacylase n=1 Tax=Spirochaeta isovalerica TaxID=150 RepID=A0A841R5W6_9SPIO|nr:YbaK/EbsC family protein [Spirochaeta isovalerica]MBB6480594.1 Ala-tRNA(Pro) deacylase [Spirochaeta isovalerica]